MSDTTNRFPPILELDHQPFMNSVTGFEKVRQEGIETFKEGTLRVLSELPDFADVPMDAKEYLALRTATFIERLYEMGIQEGVKLQRDIDEARTREDHRFKLNMIEAVAR